MIRINLLPQKRRAEKSEGSQIWLAVALALLLAEIAGFFVWHGLKTEELNDQKRKNAELSSQIEQTKKAVKNHGSIKSQLAELRAREDAISSLQSARTGPTAILLELARIMTPGRGPSVAPEKLNQLRRENPLAVYNAGWDARRLWLNEFVEKNRKVRIAGVARNGEDVSELARRMNLSGYFEAVTLLPGKKTIDKRTKLELVEFELEAKVLY
jgi:type IV pilus assembly protein PilN